MMLVSKIVTALLGVLVISAALIMSGSKKGLFNLMLQFGGLIAVPYTVPLIWGTLIKRAPAWAGWTSVIAGFRNVRPSAIAFSPLPGCNISWGGRRH